MRARLNALARALTLGVVLAGVGTAAFLHLYSQRFGVLVSDDAVDCAQIGLHAVHYHKLATDVFYPLAMVSGDTHGADIRQGPLYPLILAGLFLARGVSDNTVALCNGFLHLLTAWALFALLKLLYDRRIAILGVLAYLISMEAVGQALTATPVTTAGLFITLGVLTAARMVAADTTGTREEAGPLTALRRLGAAPMVWSAGLGVAAGLAYLTGAVASYALLGAGLVAVLALSGPHRWKALGVFLACGLIVAAPWFARNVRALGTPLPPLRQAALLMHTKAFPGYSVLWAVDQVPSALVFALAHPGQMALKFINGLTVLYRQIPQVINIYLFPLVLWGGFLATKRSPEERVVWRMLGVLLVLQAVALCLTDFAEEALRIVTAVATGLAVATLLGLARERLVRRPLIWAASAAIMLVLIFPYAASVGLGPRSADPATVNPGVIRSLSTQVRDLRVASDRPWHVAWYGECPALLLPNDVKDLELLGARFPVFSTIHVIYLSRQRAAMGGRDSWVRAMRGDRDAAATVMARWPGIMPMQGDEFILMRSELRGLVRERTPG